MGHVLRFEGSRSPTSRCHDAHDAHDAQDKRVGVGVRVRVHFGKSLPVVRLLSFLLARTPRPLLQVDTVCCGV